jgi:putative ABC transport system substrate-binding protein
MDENLAMAILTTVDGIQITFAAKTVSMLADHDANTGLAVTCVYGVTKEALQIRESVQEFLTRLRITNNFAQLTRPNGFPIGTFAKELVGLQPDAILAQTTPVAVAIARETKAIPIVFVTVSDPIGSGLAISVTHPGGNITGFTFVESAMGGKWVELLKEIAPRTARMALLFNPATAPPLQFYMPSIQTAALSFAVEVSTAPVHNKEEIELVIAGQASSPGGSLIVMPDAFNAANRELIITLAARYGVPTMFGNNFAELGGLIFYGADFAESFRLGAGYIDRILKGAKPGELPIQLPSKFKLAINLKTAKALNQTVPSSLLATADEVIE